jgi:hypothetical protein
VSIVVFDAPYDALQRVCDIKNPHLEFFLGLGEPLFKVLNERQWHRHVNALCRDALEHETGSLRAIGGFDYAGAQVAWGKPNDSEICPRHWRLDG